VKPSVFFNRSLLAVAVAAASPVALAHDSEAKDFGAWVEHQLEARSEQLFGVKQPLDASAPETAPNYRTATQDVYDQILLAKGLKAEYVTRTAANATDMMLLWPNETNPTHMITAVEEFGPHKIGTLPSGIDKLTPSVQRIDLATGQSEIILRGLAGADGIRMTPWGTIFVAEETSGGAAYEIIDPMNVSNHTVTNRAMGTIVDADGNPSAKVVKRTALPLIAWEGIGILESGVIFAGDELRPGSPANNDGGAIFKFVPSVAYNPANGPISELAQSPLVNGSVYALQSTCVNSEQRYGQGCEIGMGAWIAVNATSARADANSKGATGFYRPEDLELDPMYSDSANPTAVRFCVANTGNEGANNYGEVICGIDSEPLVTVDGTGKPKRTTTINRFVEGHTDMNQSDNLAFQPVTGNLFVIEDHDNGDVWSCLPDGTDRDIKSDGCVKILSVKDTSAEPTGFFFTPDGKTAYVSIQHSDDGNMPLVDDYGTDDVIKITGFKVGKNRD
jgi:hypothetical protein